MTVRTRILMWGGVLSCLLIAVEARPVADSTKSDAKRSGIRVSAQRVGTTAGMVTQTIDIAADRSITPSADRAGNSTDATAPDAGVVTTAPADTDSIWVYAIPWHSVNSGGTLQIGEEGGGIYAANSSVAQSATGTGASENYEAGTGYWYGADTTSVDCICDCFADPACDGMTNVVDVVMGVNVAFRGADPVEDPNPLCPLDDTDVDCSGFTNVIDVVKFVNVAFRGGDPETNFCDPCP